jgi:hypothetical protein
MDLIVMFPCAVLSGFSLQVVSANVAPDVVETKMEQFLSHFHASLVEMKAEVRIRHHAVASFLPHSHFI